MATITWSLYDNVAGGACRVLRNGVPYSTWNLWTNTTQIICHPDTGALGVWNYTLQYNDTTGLWGAPIVVLITIEDETTPWSNTPSDATYASGTPAVIPWILYDDIAGGMYQVLRNGTSYTSWEGWANGINLNVEIDTLSVGIWNYTILYNDSANLWGTPNTVIITITLDKSGIPGFALFFGLISLIALTVNYYLKKTPLARKYVL
jgi:hypothetical protein